jgi:hypothetical protein
MEYKELLEIISNILFEFDAERPIHKNFQCGIGPFGEPQLIKIIAEKLSEKDIPAKTKKTPDLVVLNEFGIEAKIVRPFGDNGKEAENWSVNLLHPYSGNVSLISDALKLLETGFPKKCLLVIGYEHNPSKIDLSPLLDSFELIGKEIMHFNLSQRMEFKKFNLVHPEHQVLRCVGWEIIKNNFSK